MMVATGRVAPGCSLELLPQCASIDDSHAVRCCADEHVNPCFATGPLRAPLSTSKR